MTRCNSRHPDLIARGHLDPRVGSHMMRANLYLTRELFERIRFLAIENGSSFAATARELVCDGLMLRVMSQIDQND